LRAGNCADAIRMVSRTLVTQIRAARHFIASFSFRAHAQDVTGDHFGPQQTHCGTRGGLTFNVMRTPLLNDALQTDLAQTGRQPHRCCRAPVSAMIRFFAMRRARDDLGPNTLLILCRAGCGSSSSRFHIDFGTAQMHRSERSAKIQGAGANRRSGSHRCSFSPKDVRPSWPFHYSARARDQRHQVFDTNRPPKIANAHFRQGRVHEKS